MSYQMVVVFTISMAKISETTGEMLSKVLLAKNVDEKQASCELEGRTADKYHMRAVLGNMVESAKKHGEAFAVFYHPTESIEFYVSATEQIG